jgi:hypothetical protein
MSISNFSSRSSTHQVVWDVQFFLKIGDQYCHFVNVFSPAVSSMNRRRILNIATTKKPSAPPFHP